MTNEEFEFRQAWTQKAGEVSGLKCAMELVYERAAQQFRRGEDEKARLLREVATDLEERHTKASAELRAFINKSMKPESSEDK